MRPIPPGSTIGVLGSGQLGRMFAIAARQMGYRVHTLSPDYDTPTGQVADVEISAPYEDIDAVERLARNADVITFEFENVPSEAVETASRYAPVRPSGRILHLLQHRVREKTFLRDAGLPVTPFSPVTSFDELAASFTGSAAMIKTASWGYDGKGQRLIRAGDDIEAAWSSLQTDDAVLEELIELESEISVIVARGLGGAVRTFEVTENHHVRNILDVSVAPAAVDPKISSSAVEIARTVAETLELEGVLCIEFFLDTGGRLLINELAPRPHNSGHWTIDACVTSQFEQQLRAICGLPLGSAEQLRPVAMANLLGDLWRDREPDFAAACSLPGVKLHLYGKAEPRPGRKMGHLTAVAATRDAALENVTAARNRLHS